jgi:hypothetical protein
MLKWLTWFNFSMLIGFPCTHSSVARLSVRCPKWPRRTASINPINSSPTMLLYITGVPGRTVIWNPHIASALRIMTSVIPSPLTSASMGRMMDVCGNGTDARMSTFFTDRTARLFSPARSMGLIEGAILLDWMRASRALWLLPSSQVGKSSWYLPAMTHSFRPEPPCSLWTMPLLRAITTFELVELTSVELILRVIAIWWSRWISKITISVLKSFCIAILIPN